METGKAGLPLTGRVAVVAGGTRNIGRAIAYALARDGASVAIVSRHLDDDARATLAALQQISKGAIHVAADIANESAVNGMADTVARAFQGIDILVNVAAIRRIAALADLTYEKWREVMAANLDGPFLCCRAAVPHMKNQTGRIINLGGISAHRGAENRAHVIASKAGLIGLTRALAIELAPRGITVNCISPGPIDTQRGADTGVMPNHPQGMMPPLGRLGTPEEISAMATMLAGPTAGFITGQVMHVNGGLFLG